MQGRLSVCVWGGGGLGVAWISIFECYKNFALSFVWLELHYKILGFNFQAHPLGALVVAVDVVEIAVAIANTVPLMLLLLLLLTLMLLSFLLLPLLMLLLLLLMLLPLLLPLCLRRCWRDAVVYVIDVADFDVVAIDIVTIAGVVAFMLLLQVGGKYFVFKSLQKK